MAGERDPRSSSDLVREFVRATESMPPSSSADLAGVSEATYNRWRRQAPRILREPQRVRIERYLGVGTPREAEVWLG